VLWKSNHISKIMKLLSDAMKYFKEGKVHFGEVKCIVMIV